jgi:hypothetical protein
VAAGPDTTDSGFARDYDAPGFHCTAGPETQPPGGGMSWWPYQCNNSTDATITFNRYA